jgi:hypothetical protein
VCCRLTRAAGRASELSVFALRFDGSAQQVNATLQNALELKLLAATACAQQMVHPALTAPFGQYEPDVEARFAETVSPLVNLSGALIMYQSAMVPSASRAAFEAGAAASAPRTHDAMAAALQAFGISDAFPAPPGTPPHYAPAAAFYLPLLHISPMTPQLAAFTMYDVMSASNLPGRHDAASRAISTLGVAWSDILESTVVSAAGSFDPSTQLVVPALVPGAVAGNGTLLGTCTVVFDWQAVLKRALPAFVTSVTAVLTSFSGRQATFALRHGVVSIIGFGDLHDARFDGNKRTAVATVAGSTWSVALYPTDALLDSYLTQAPLRNAVIIAVVVSLCVAIFAFYELHVRRRANAMNVLLRRNLAELGRMKAAEAAAQKRLMEARIQQQDQFVSVSGRCGCCACS